MKDPVVASDGHSYEREAIEKWLQIRRTSPKTNLPLSDSVLKPNFALKSIIEDYQIKEKKRISLVEAKALELLGFGTFIVSG